MKYRLEYSQIVRRKIKLLKSYLSEQYDKDFAITSVRELMHTARKLQDNPELGVDMSAIFGIDTDFRYLYINHNYLFYYIEEDTVIIAEMFGEKEDFLFKLFGISGRSEESVEYWGE